jgi:uncharacterized SAM-binding protein YcdF (DUF218 family)
VQTIRKFLKWGIVIIFAVLLLDAFLIASFSVFSNQIENADSIIVMGAAINSPALYNRSLEGLKLYEESRAEVLVLSGGRISDKDISEATYMQRAIQSKASKPLNIKLDEQSHNTFENIRNSKALVPNAKTTIIVTDKFHLARSVITAKALGFEKVYWSSPETKYPKEQLRYHYFREFVAILSYFPKFVQYQFQ